MGVELRECRVCGIEKPYTTEFRHGHRRCNECARTDARKRRAALYQNPLYPEIRKAQRDKVSEALALRRHKAENLFLLDQIKSAHCADCDLSFPPYVMDFDHLNPETKDFDINRSGTRAWTRILQEVAKCDLVCARCHRLRTWSRKGSPKYVSSQRRLITELKSVPCTDCQSSFHYCQMDFDHVRGKKTHAIGNFVGGRAELLREVAKCDVVCANCHRLRTQVQQYGGYRKSAVADVAVPWKYKSYKNPSRSVMDTPKKRATKHQPWHNLLGDLPDNEVAKVAGVSPSVVTARRIAQGIPRVPRSKRGTPPQFWHALVGTQSDHEVAALAGISFSAVAAYRRRIGTMSFRAARPKNKPPVVYQSPPQPRAWHHAAGTAPDKQVAKAYGISIASVSTYRKRLGIAAYRFRSSVYIPLTLGGQVSNQMEQNSEQ